MKKQLFIYLLFFTVNHATFSAQGPTDSLRNSLSQAVDDAARLPLLEALATVYLQQNQLDSFRHVAEQGQQLAQALGEVRYQGRFMVSEATYLSYTASRRETIDKYLEALALFESIPDSLEISATYASLMDLYQELGQLDQARIQFERAQQWLPAGNPLQAADLNNRIGRIYSLQRGEENLNIALRYFEENLPIYQALEKDYELGFTYMNIAIALDELGANPDSALALYGLAGEYYQKAHRPLDVAVNLGEIASFYINQPDYVQAQRYALRALHLIDSLGADSRKVVVLSKLAEIHRHLQAYEEAIAYAQEGIALAQRLQDVHTLADLLGIISRCYYYVGNSEEAFFSEIHRSYLRDSMVMANNQLQITELEESFQIRERESQLALQESQLTQQRRLIWGIGLLA
ncbi:MAG: hypothetical protein AAFQ98_10055, partial [Bacteroidota bacterium]